MTHVVNEDNPQYNSDGGNDTEDKVFLLSIEEANKYFTEDESRKCIPTQYTDYKEEYFMIRHYTGTYQWWLRSPGFNGGYAAYVYRDGQVDRIGDCVDREDIVRPAMWINLE